MRRLIAVFLLVPATVLAYDGERAKNNLAHEFAECGAYYMFVAGAPGLAEDTATGLQKRGEKAAEFSIDLSTPDITRARHELATKTMIRELKGTWDNISIINNKYGYPCNRSHGKPKSSNAILARQEELMSDSLLHGGQPDLRHKAGEGRLALRWGSPK